MDENAKGCLGCLAVIVGIAVLILLGRALVGGLGLTDAEEGNPCTKPGEKVVAEDGTELVCR
jgi:hypothetical protein